MIAGEISDRDLLILKANHESIVITKTMILQTRERAYTELSNR